MGLMCSWIAVRTRKKAALLRHLGMVETDEPVEPGCDQSAMSLHQTDSGWTIVLSEDFAWADTDRTLALSQFGMTLGVQFEDKVAMETIVHAADGGESLWRVSRNAEADEPLQVTGTPPKEFAAIRQEFEAKQAEDEDTEWLSEIPLELARTISGFRVDEDSAEFMALEPRASNAKFGKLDARSRRAPYGIQGLRHNACSVIAVRTNAKEQLFDYLGRVETDRPVWPANGYNGICFYETDTGWIVLLSESYYWYSDKRLRDLSRFGLAIGTGMGHSFHHLDLLTGALDGEILFTVPPALEDFQAQQLPAEVREALDQPWSQFVEDQSKGRANSAMTRAARLLWAFDLEKRRAPFTALKRRWPWTKRPTLLG